MHMDAIAVFIAQYLYLFVLLAAAIFFFTRSKPVMKSVAICGIVIAPLAYIIAKIWSRFYYDPRPFVIGHFTPLIAHAADNGFPSDHVLLTGAAAMTIWFYNKKLSTALWMSVFLIGWARVHAGIHHWIDVAGSIFIALLSGLTYYLLIHRVHEDKKIA